MKLVYKFQDFIKIFRFNKKNKYINVKNFHRIELNNAVMVLCENNNKILFLEEFRIGLNKKSWGLPGGFVENKENPKKAAIREIREETGLEIKNIKFFKKYFRNGNYHCGIDYLYYAKVNTQDIKTEKKVKFRWLNDKQILEFIKRNKFETPGVISSAFYFIINKGKF